LILRKIINIVATRFHILKLKCTKFDFSPRPRWESSQRSPRPPAGFKGPYFLREGEGEGREGRGERGGENHASTFSLHFEP